MIIKYKVEINESSMFQILTKLTNQIYKLLPLREENQDWEKAVETVQEEISGMSNLFADNQVKLFILMSKLEGLFGLIKDSDFLLYRRVIFECLNLIGQIKSDYNG